MAQGSTHPEPALYLLGQTLRQYRKQLGLTQKDLAAAIHVSTVYISNVERGKRNVSILVLLRLALALQIPFADLVQPLFEHPELLQNKSPTAVN